MTNTSTVRAVASESPTPTYASSDNEHSEIRTSSAFQTLQRILLEAQRDTEWSGLTPADLFPEYYNSKKSVAKIPAASSSSAGKRRASGTSAGHSGRRPA